MSEGALLSIILPAIAGDPTSVSVWTQIAEDIRDSILALAETSPGAVSAEFVTELKVLRQQASEKADPAGASLVHIMNVVDGLFTELGGFLDFATTQSLPGQGLLETLSGLLLKPKRVPGEPCLAPAPLLRDLLDVALGRVTGGLGATVAKVGRMVRDLLLPAAAKGDDLPRFVRATLEDPITAALNFVLGARNQIDCVVTAHKDVGESVIEVGFKRLVGFVEGALG